MNLHRSIIVAAAVSALGASCTLAQSQANESDNHSQQSSAQSQQQAPEGYVLVKESVITLTVNEPQNHFIRAQELMSQGETRAAAAETQIAAAYLDMQASRDQNGQQGKDLQTAADHLRHLAKELRNANKNESQNQQTSQKGQQQMPQQERKLDKRLTEAFANADHALAAHFQAKAQQELNQKNRTEAGYDLDASATALKAACLWTSKQCPQSVGKAVADAHRAADELLTVSGEREIGSGNKQASNQESAEDQAEPASARINRSQQNEGNTSAQSQGQKQQMQNAHQAVQELGKAIESCAGEFKSGNSNNQSAENSTGQQSQRSQGNSSSGGNK